MSSTVLVTGATGLLGRAMFERFQYSGVLTIGQGHTRAVPPTLQRANLENPEEIKALMDNVKPQIVIHCAANKSPDLCDKDPEQARRLNVEATRCLAEECNAREALLIYISTDYVFPGTEGEAPYEIDAETRPPNLYGQLKRDGELALLEATKDTGMGVVLRVPVLYGSAKDSSESAINCLVDKVKEAQDPKAGIKMDDWAQRYPTNVEDVARIVRDIVIKYVKEKHRVKELPHILHYTSEDCMTKYDVCVRFAKVLGISIPGMIANKQGNDPNAGVQRPYDTHLSNKALREMEIDVRGCEFNAWWRRELGAFRK